MEALRQDKKYTYTDILTWPEDERWELIDGVPFLMTQPSTAHERISMEISNQLYNFLKGKPCEVFTALGVHLSADDTYLVPDITVICDESKIDDKGCNGEPDLVMEIVSQSTMARDKVLKFNKYLSAGVREYWIIDPNSKIVQINVLENGKYVSYAYDETGVVKVAVLDGCTISLPDVFAQT